jgi:hypothetical protein
MCIYGSIYLYIYISISICHAHMYDIPLCAWGFIRNAQQARPLPCLLKIRKTSILRYALLENPARSTSRSSSVDVVVRGLRC